MPRFRFALSSNESMREVGIVQCDSFDDAMSALTERFTISEGDQLEIGVWGFPPARFRYVDLPEGDLQSWKPLGRQAA